MNRVFRSIIATVLAFVLLICLLPSASFAEGGTGLPEWGATYEKADLNTVSARDSSSGDEYSAVSPVKEGSQQTIHQLVISYYISGSGEPFSVYVNSLLTGETYSVISPYLEGYWPDKPIIEGIMPADTVKVDVFYSEGDAPTHKLTVVLQYEDGTEAEDPMILRFHEGEGYRISPPDVDDCTCQQEPIEGTMWTEDLTVTFVYTKNLHALKIDYVYPDGTTAVDQFNASYAKRDKYSVVSPHIDGFLPDLQVVQGLMWKDPISVTVTYTPAVYTLSGLPTEHATVTVNGNPVTPDSEGKITVFFDDEIRILPDKEYMITEFRRLALSPVITVNYPVDNWGDGTGYQMLLDADHDMYPVLMNLESILSPDRFDTYGSFDGFEYFVPRDADYSFTPENAVFPGSSVSASVPAGTYDMCIINPTESSNFHGMYFVGIGDHYGDVTKGRKDDIVFEKGKAYVFQISRIPSVGDYAVYTAVTTGPSEDADYAVPGEDGSYSFTMPGEDVALSVKMSRVIRYDVIEGYGSEHPSGADKSLKFVLKRNFDDELTIERFVGAAVDDKDIRENIDFTRRAGSLVIELQPSFLETLSTGAHILTVSFSDAESVSVPFTVMAVPAPPTGEYGTIWMYVWFTAAAVLMAFIQRQHAAETAEGKMNH